MRRSDVLIIFGFVVAGALAWMLQLRPPLVVDPASLDEIPLAIGVWRGEAVPVPSKIDEMLRADHHVQRAYIDLFGDPIWLYVGYYGTERGGRPEHTPWQCYPSQGWEIVDQDILTIDRENGLRANEIVVDNGGDRRLVHFWYQSHRRAGMIGGLDQTADRLVGRLFEGRADGSLIRLSTPIPRPGDEDAARLRLRAFGKLVQPHLQSSWPTERVQPESGGRLSAPPAVRSAPDRTSGTRRS